MKSAKPVHRTAEIDAAVADHDKAKSDLAAHKVKIRDLETRIKEIEIAITDAFASSYEVPSFGDLTIDEIKKLADSRQSVTHHGHALIAAKDEAIEQITTLNRDMQGLELLISGAREHCWRLVRAELLKQLNRGLIKKLVATGYVCGMANHQIIESIVDDNADYSLLAELSEQYEIPV